MANSITIDCSAGTDFAQVSQAIAAAVRDHNPCIVRLDLSNRAILTQRLIQICEHWVSIGLRVDIINNEPHLDELVQFDTETPQKRIA